MLLWTLGCICLFKSGNFVLLFPDVALGVGLLGYICCCCSVTKLCLALCNPMDCSKPGFLPCPSLSPWVHKLMSIELVLLSNHLILCHPLPLLLSIFPSIIVFSSEYALCISGQSIEASASILPMSIQGWFPLGLTGLISLPSKGLSRVFSKTTIGKHLFFSTQPSFWSNSHPYMTIGKTIALTIQTFVGKVMSLLFNMLCW